MRFPNDDNHTPPTFFSKRDTVKLYTALAILESMRTDLGLEAMLEFMKEYRVSLEKENPRLKGAVCLAIRLMDIEKIYKAAVKNDR